MSRILIHGALLLLPFVLYFLYLWRVRRAGKEGPETTPWFMLSLAGLVLMIGSFAVVHVMSDQPSGQYTPARLQDGRIVPGDIRPGEHKN
ncbi:DUF6111 family protein [Ferrovibrio sp.]|uniref:DUF6111 family protein n=1 Tax=Ferrovibrio sp. TaxID=1917215 RepID=UPI0025BC8A8A|nr:DUF6111 family protein [Ferrovibrio sp.]MBX3455687.1 hypothetical protein [Ferrovibrio sp.]